MPGHLILTGGGNESQTREILSFFLKLVPKNKRILYIPIPSNIYTFGMSFDWIAKKALPNTKIDIWTDLKKRKFSNLKEYGAVYLGGGNTYRFLYDMKKTGFDELLRKYYSQGGIILGGSAGAIVLGKDIRLASIGKCSDRNKVKLKDLKGLNLVRDFSISCHHQKKDFSSIKNYSRKSGITVLCLPEPAGFHLSHEKIRVIGRGDAYLVDKNKIKILKHNYVF